MNVRPGGLGEPTGSHDAREVTLEQCHAGALHRDIGPQAHRKPDVGRSEGGCVVDAVSGRGDHPALFAELLDDVALVVWEDFGLDPVDPQAASDCFGGDPVVAGQHDHLDPLGT